MSIEDSLFFYETELDAETRKECEEDAITRAFAEAGESEGEKNYYELKVRFYLQNLVQAYKEMMK